MKSILVDTSVWVDALIGKRSKQALLLEKLIEQEQEIVLCPVIIQEILQGIRDDRQFNMVKENLEGFPLLSLDPAEAAIGAAQLYRTARKKGLTIRKSNDCLIAFYAIKSGARLLHKDSDFDKLARHTGLLILKV